MADEQNNYFEFLDIPDGNGGTERWYASDAEARAAIAQLDPASVINVSDITALTQEQCEGLVAGGAVNKSDSTGKHAYKVTFRSDTGMCLTYADAENVETVSYDKVEGTWTYNSTDITPISRCSQVPNKADKVSGATNNNLAALNTNGNLKDSGKSVEDFATAEDMKKMVDYTGADMTHDYVDLGLPSGTLWATDIVGGNDGGLNDVYYMYGKGSTKYNKYHSAYTGTETPLDLSADTARQEMGGDWHTPTKAQWEELIANTDYSVSGNYLVFTSKTDSTKSLRLVMDGYETTTSWKRIGTMACYWSSTPSETASEAYYLEFDSNTENAPQMVSISRSRGVCVVGVMDGTSLREMLDSKADKSELPTYATTSVCQDIISELT